MDKKACTRRDFLHKSGSFLGLAILTGITGRIFMGRTNKDAEFARQNRRYAWQIDPEKCEYCGLCQTACVRKPSAVRSINDQKMCSNCVVCYGFTSDRHIDSELIDSKAKRICPFNAVRRRNFSGGRDGLFIYSIDQRKCHACGSCVKECNTLGSKSMFLVIRPDLCLGCNACAIAQACPSQAIERIPLDSATDRRDIFMSDGEFIPECLNKS